MTIKFSCPNGHVIKAVEKYRGKRVRCPKCKVVTLVEEQAPSSREPSDLLMSDNNPYAPPRSDSQETTVGEWTGIGVFNDRGTLVLSRAGFQLPDVCLKSGEPTEKLFELNQRALPKTRAIGTFLAAGAVGLVIARSMFGEDFELKLPMRQDSETQKEKEKRSWIVVGIGFALILLGIIGSVFAEALMALSALGMVVGIVGLFLGGVKSVNGPFSISNFNTQYLWVEGANKSVVAMFERLPTR